MRRPLHPLALLALVSCLKPEQGIDDTVLYGVVTIPPAAAIAESGDGRDRPLDTLDVATAAGDLSWRWQPVDASIRSFEEVPNPEGGVNERDRDWITFSPAASGAFTLVLTYEVPVTDTGDSGGDSGDSGGDSGDSGGDSGDSGEDPADTADTAVEPDCAIDEGLDAAWTADNLAFRILVFDLSEGEDPACLTPLVNASTDGAAGRLEIPLELTAGVDYAVRISGLANRDRLSPDYRLWLSGSDPAEAGIKVGAYQPFTDIYARGAPVGGGEVIDWSLNAETLTWTGAYTMRKLRTVSTEEGQNDYCDIDPEHPDCAPLEQTSVSEGVSEIAIVGGDFANLNQALPAGTLYNSAPLNLTLNLDVENTAPEPVVLDAVAPKVIGWTFPEVEPNDVFVDLGNDAEFYPLDIANIDPANELPAASGVGFVDIIEATQSFPIADPEWNGGDYDTFAFTVPESMGAAILTDWADAGVNLDVHLYDSAGILLAVGWSPADVKPELFNTADWEVVFEPGQTYYLVVMGWSGPAADYPYTIELEWMSP